VSRSTTTTREAAEKGRKGESHNAGLFSWVRGGARPAYGVRQRSLSHDQPRGVRSSKKLACAEGCLEKKPWRGQGGGGGRARDFWRKTAIGRRVETLAIARLVSSYAREISRTGGGRQRGR